MSAKERSLVERVARAITRAEDVDPEDIESDFAPTFNGGQTFRDVPAWTKRRRQAQAAIRAMKAALK